MLEKLDIDGLSEIDDGTLATIELKPGVTLECSVSPSAARRSLVECEELRVQIEALVLKYERQLGEKIIVSLPRVTTLEALLSRRSCTCTDSASVEVPSIPARAVDATSARWRGAARPASSTGSRAVDSTTRRQRDACSMDYGGRPTDQTHRSISTQELRRCAAPSRGWAEQREPQVCC